MNSFRRYAALSVLTVLLALCSACVKIIDDNQTSKPPRTGGGTIANATSPLQLAEQAFDKGDYKLAADYYAKFLAETPNPARLESILAAYGLSAERSGQYDRAAEAYTRLAGEFPGGRFAQEANLRLTGVMLAGGQYAQARAKASQLLTEPGRSAQTQSDLKMVIAKSFWAENKFSEAADTFIEAWYKGDDFTKKESSKGLAACLAKFDDQKLAQIQRQYGQNYPGPEATYFLAYNAARRGDAAAVKTQTDYFNQYFSGHYLSAAMAAMAPAAGGQLPSAASLAKLVMGDGFSVTPQNSLIVDGSLKSAVGEASQSTDSAGAAQTSTAQLSSPVNIAVILPLSGDKSSKYANEILEGLKLAVKQNKAGGQTVGLLVLDSQGQPETAKQLVAQAAARPEVVAIVGPFLSREATPAAQAAQAAGMPIITISQRPDLTGQGQYVFRLFLTPKHQSQAVARYAVREKGHQQLGIIFPDDAYGQMTKKYYEEEIRALGASLAVVDSYSLAAKNWAEAVTRVTGGKSVRQASSKYQANVGFTAMFLPDSAAAAAQILPLMAYHDVTKVQYLGSSLWVNNDLLTSSGRYIQDAAIPVAISEHSRRPESLNFIRDFQAAYGRAPEQFGAYGYDAGLAIIKAVSQSGTDRRDLAAALSSIRSIPGVTGPFRFGSDGEYLIYPLLLTVKGQGFALLREPDAWLN